MHKMHKEAQNSTMKSSSTHLSTILVAKLGKMESALNVLTIFISTIKEFAVK